MKNKTLENAISAGMAACVLRLSLSSIILLAMAKHYTKPTFQKEYVLVLVLVHERQRHDQTRTHTDAHTRRKKAIERKELQNVRETNSLVSSGYAKEFDGKQMSQIQYLECIRIRTCASYFGLNMFIWKYAKYSFFCTHLKLKPMLKD